MKRAGWVFLIMLIIIGCLWAAGYLPAYILNTGSMEPEFIGGDVVLLKRYSGEGVEVGDIIVFRSLWKDKRIFHRIVEISTEGYITKGDNNGYLDYNIQTDKDIEAIFLFKIPLGKITFFNWLSEKATEKYLAENN